MAKLIVIYGNVGAGKGTLVSNLYNQVYSSSGPWTYCASDTIREELSGDVGGKSRGFTKDGKPFDVFVTMRERVEAAMGHPGVVIADSTGMSPAFVALVNDWRKRYEDVTVIRLFCNYETWQKREGMRTDRWTLEGGKKVGFKMPEVAYFNSFKAKFEAPPDLEIDTTNMSPHEVFLKAVETLSKGTSSHGLHYCNTPEKSEE